MKKTMLKIIDSYQKNVSPNLDRRCRHTPSCSNYAKVAYTRYNFFYASFLTIKRLLKCNRLFKPQYDPVPQKFSKIIKASHKIMKRNQSKLIAVDATCGNGHDSIYLSKYYSEVYAFDIQDLAIKRTKEKLFYINNIHLFKDDFHNLKSYVEKCDLIVFNLGFLPGSDKKIKTQDYASNTAILSAYELLNNKGILIICCYTKHDGGYDEYLTIKDTIKSLPYKENAKFKNGEILITIKKEVLS